MARYAFACALVLTAALLFGFFVFASRVTRTIAPELATADGIVVLTGGALRIRSAADLLESGRGRRLLITGVYRKTTPEQILELSGLETGKFDCCVDLDYAALNTRGNAEQTREWVLAHNFRSLIIVTASYHMPRSIAEFRSHMPGVRLYEYPVTPDRMRGTVWWNDGEQIALLGIEYLKYLSSTATCWIERAVPGLSLESAPAPERSRPDKPPQPANELNNPIVSKG